MKSYSKYVATFYISKKVPDVFGKESVATVVDQDL